MPLRRRSESDTVFVTQAHDGDCPCRFAKRWGQVFVVCPSCLRKRDRYQTFVTHGCTNRDDCARHVRLERDRLHKALCVMRGLIDPHNPCHDGLREALLDAFAGDAQSEGKQNPHGKVEKDRLT